MIKILIADDHGIVRTGLKLLFERLTDMAVVGEAADGREAVRLAAELQPDVVIMDIGMPLLNGLEATVQIVRANERIAVIILSMYTDESYIVEPSTPAQRAICSRTMPTMMSSERSGRCRSDDHSSRRPSPKHCLRITFG